VSVKISARTKILGIFGHPIEHTLSPAMHNAAIEASGLDMIYIPFSVRASRLRDAVGAIRGLDILGINITIPHKEAVIDLLDKLSEEARAIGAVNTIINSNGMLIGFNTDGQGYLRSLKGDTGFNPKEKDIVMVGAGGAARGILNALAGEGPGSIIIANRTIAKAELLINEFKVKFPDIDLRACALDVSELRDPLKNATLLINTTSLGMEGKGILELPLEELPGDAVVSDIVYKPLKTDFLKRAQDIGLIIHDGLGMLVQQGAISFKIWTGLDAPVDIMRNTVERALEKE
jgi:shikimate dehydrogenase